MYSFNSFSSNHKIFTECVICTRHCSRWLGYNCEKRKITALEKLTYSGDFVCLEGMDVCLCVRVCCAHTYEE